MRRRLLTVAIFLLAGAVVNVAVAWGCALYFHASAMDGYNYVNRLRDVCSGHAALADGSILIAGGEAGNEARTHLLTTTA